MCRSLSARLSCLPTSPAEICVFEEHEEAGIETAELLEEISPDEQARACEPVNVAHGRTIGIPLQVLLHPLWE